ncbi:heavy metal translocating P-type ATPase [Poseidonibacter ostreae]|uniref:Copper-transporting ATPase n=1 Tax=Poseidonibacter ostreae TaxID=2654171 RepID=A0A6L4WPH5_9BACT|nr:heavy metal translocating P-type ATPase [Poseidonibacter ostreae]KAB7884768.1 heavy metal translocating P-type ATPase [Poseidonibacter ostreae]KAB7885979.1 heavy metal translocating P-type ATPase [Poseidonibacter ostreae]KAB7888771.1 heavy metal translocating P-type ATPase [Poseidonibacter ostreae]
MPQVKCNHCHLSFDDEVMIKEKELNFCCKGCQGVYHLLKSDGLDSFYDKLGNKTITPPLNLEDDDISKFDTPSFMKNYTSLNKDGFYEVDLIIEGIHCAACVWLNEKILHDTKGLIEANINFTTNKAKVIWDGDELKLSDIILRIRSIGYNAYAYDSSVADEKATKAKREYFIKMMVAVIASMNIMMLSVAKYTGFFTGITPEVMNMIHIGEFLLSTPVLFYSGWVFFKGAYFGLKNKMLNMDFLVSSGALLTYIYSLFILFGAKGESYFDSVAMIITFVLVGKYLEVIGKKSAVDTLDKIKSSLPLEAVVIKGENKKQVALNSINIGDIIEIKTGEKVPVDGVIIKGEGAFDEASLTGESLPIFKKIGDSVYSGTINTNNLIHFEVTKDFKNSTFSSIVTLLEDSLNSKPKIQDKANEVSRGFTVSILTLSLITFLVWYFFGLDLGFDYEGTSHFEKSFIVAISVIVIACPCALALATPIASLIGISELAKKGLLFKEAKFIESLAKVNSVVFDKTGTLTKGELTVVKALILNEDIEKLNLLYSLLDTSTHPISKSVKKYLLSKYDLKLEKLSNIRNIDAKGMSAQFTNSEGKALSLIGGNLDLILEEKIKYDLKVENSVFIFAIEDEVIASFELVDEVKDYAKDLIQYLQNKNIEVIMLTGDNEQVASKVSSQLNIKKHLSKQTPISKAAYIKSLRTSGKIVVMVGDGVNDSVALSNADVAIAMGTSADISMAVSDIVLLNSSLTSLKDAFEISSRTYNFIKQNLAISLVYNLVTIPFAMLGYVIPLVAALSMSLSSLLVVLNSLRIKIK